jgi:hypothetical protein
MTVKSIFFVLTLIAMAGVLVSLIAGVAVMTKGGEVNKKYSNRLMQARVYLQGLALLFFAIAVFS